jgi:hypothetical protein
LPKTDESLDTTAETREPVFSVDPELFLAEPTLRAGTVHCPGPLTAVLSVPDEVLSVEVLVLLSVPSLKRFSVESRSNPVRAAKNSLTSSDIHARAELSERILDEATLRRLSTMG